MRFIQATSLHAGLVVLLLCLHRSNKPVCLHPIVFVDSFQQCCLVSPPPLDRFFPVVRFHVPIRSTSEPLGLASVALFVGGQHGRITLYPALACGLEVRSRAELCRVAALSILALVAERRLIGQLVFA